MRNCVTQADHRSGGGILGDGYVRIDVIGCGNLNEGREVRIIASGVKNGIHTEVDRVANRHERRISIRDLLLQKGKLGLQVGFAHERWMKPADLCVSEAPEVQYAKALTSLPDEERASIEPLLPHLATRRFDSLYDSLVRRLIAGIEAELSE